MKRELRLRKNEDFSKVIKYKNSIANPGFIIYSMPNQLKNVRVGISVSKSLGNAVIRNKIKRQVREMCKEVFDFCNNEDYIIIVRKGFLSNTFISNKNSLTELYLKSSIKRK